MAGVSFDLGGMRALVTGGRRGIGLAIARALRDAGAEVVVTGVGEGPKDVDGLQFRRLDIRDGGSVASAAAAITELDILVNNAGVLARAGREYEPDVFAEIIGTNLIGTYRMCHAFQPHLAARQGNIINLLTIRSFIGSPLTPAYGASKAGLLQLTRTLAREWGPQGIRVNGLAPGWTRTDMNIAIQQDPEASRQVEEAAALKRWGAPEDIAGAAVYLASPAASFVTGACLLVDGGFIA